MRARIKTFGRYKYLLKNLIVKDVKLKYRRSILGILWSVLNPLLMMLVISAVFSSIFKVSVENFPVYYLTGSTLFNMLAETTNSSMTSILDSSSLIKKVYIPKYIFPLEKCMFGFINFLFSMIAVAIMWSAFLFPYIARFENTVKQTLKNAFLLMVRHLPWSLLLLVILIASALSIYIIPVLLVVIPAVASIVFDFILERLFRRYMSPEDLEREEENDMYAS